MGLLLVAAMLATSFDGVAVRLGPRRWRALHKAGLYYVMSVFAFDFLEGVVAEEKLLHAPFAALLVTAIGVRVTASKRKGRTTTPSASGASTRGENGERGGEATA